MEEELDNQPALEVEDVQDITPETEFATDLTVEDYNKVKTSYESQKVRAEKAEKELKELRSKQPLEKPTPKNDEPSNEPDYAKLAFLKSEGVTHPDDQKIVQEEANRLKLPLTDVLQMEHIKGKLKDSKDQREAQDGIPKGKGKSGGSNQQDVDYWLAKGETPTNDLELAEKVINARMRKEESKGMFSDELWT
jgi:hypothetical protein